MIYQATPPKETRESMLKEAAWRKNNPIFIVGGKKVYHDTAEDTARIKYR